MAKSAAFALLCFLSLGSLSVVRAGKVLLLPIPEDNSPIYILRHIYDELTSRGHDAYVSTLGSHLCRTLPETSRATLSNANN